MRCKKEGASPFWKGIDRKSRATNASPAIQGGNHVRRFQTGTIKTIFNHVSLLNKLGMMPEIML
jgi:hypothetical protein